ncbi:MAG: ATP-binding cassette domain-containing protein, partial [Raoultibacter sp.]
GKRSKTVLENLSLSFQPSTFYAIVGPSGSGKTTLLSLLAGLDTPTEGNVIFENNRILPSHLAAYRRKVALVFQSYNLIDYLTPRENVLLGGPCDPADLLAQVGISESDFDRSVLKLSGGQQQRVALARALARHARVLLADEPTGNLDGVTAEGVADILERCAHEHGACVIVVTHSPQLAKRADKVIDLGNGVLPGVLP